MVEWNYELIVGIKNEDLVVFSVVVFRLCGLVLSLGWVIVLCFGIRYLIYIVFFYLGEYENCFVKFDEMMWWIGIELRDEM